MTWNIEIERFFRNLPQFLCQGGGARFEPSNIGLWINSSTTVSQPLPQNAVKIQRNMMVNVTSASLYLYKKDLINTFLSWYSTLELCMIVSFPCEILRIFIVEDNHFWSWQRERFNQPGVSCIKLYLSLTLWDNKLERLSLVNFNSLV